MMGSPISTVSRSSLLALAMGLLTVTGCSKGSSGQRPGTDGSAGGSGGGGGASGSGGAGGSSDAGTDAAADAGSDGTNVGASCLPAGDAGTTPPDAGLTLVADTHFGFSGTQGACSWSYGYQVPATDNVFHLMTDWDDGGPAWWTLRGTYWTMVGPDVQHANGTATSLGRSPVEQWSVRRWTSTVTGTITISGSLRKTAAPDTAASNGIDARIVVDGVTEYSQFIAGTDTVGVSFAITAPVVAGSYVDFVLDPHLSHDLSDTTFFAAQIWK
jgi:hypothetical protein